MLPPSSWCFSFALTFQRATLLLGLLGLVLSVQPFSADAQTRLTPHPNSRFWIQGEATTHSFTCVVNRVEGMALLPTEADSVSTTGDEAQTKVIVRVPVRAVECGNDRMTRDLQETLEMEEHPEIRFELVHGTMGEPADTAAAWRRVDALGPLTIAGTKRLTRLHAAARAFDDDHFRIRGCLPIRMTYFGIEPPTKAFGLIKVKNRVEVQFDLLAQTDTPETSSPFDTLSLTNSPSCDE